MEEYADRVPEVQRTQFMNLGDDMRDVRYGEVIPIYRKGAKLYVEVYNTTSLNELPDELLLASISVLRQLSF